MKKFLALMLSVLMIATLCASFASCGETDEDLLSGKYAEDSNAKTYVIATDTTFAPFEYLDAATSKYVGIDLEILQAIAKDQKFNYKVDCLGFDAACTALETKQCDGVIAGMSIKPARQEKYDFSDSYFVDGSGLVVKKNSTYTTLDEVLASGGKFAAKRGTNSCEKTLEILKGDDSRITYYDGSTEIYQAVMIGDCVACLEDYSVINYTIKQNNMDLKVLGGPVEGTTCDYGFAVLKGLCPELITMFNAGLKNIKENGTYKQILEKYGIEA